MRPELEDSFAALAAAELPGLRRFAYAISGDWNRADDLTQGALERVYRSWPRTHTVGSPGAYLRKALVRLAISEARRPWRRREQVMDAVPDVAGDDHATGVVHRQDLALALAGLTVKQRAVVVLRFLEDRPVAEVAEVLGIAPGTVKRQSHDAIGRLRDRLGRQYAPEQAGPIDSGGAK